VGEQHLAGYAGHPACEPAVLCDISEERRREAAAGHPDLRIVADPDEVLTDPDIHVVSIASYDDAHAEQVVRALEHGKHVFVEKPLCLEAADAVRIRALLRERPELRLSSNLILRQSPRFRLIKRMIAEGELGTLFHVAGEYNYGRLRKLTHGWRGRIDSYSVVLGGAVHIVDLLLWLTGRRIVEVAAIGNRISSAGSAFRHDDQVAALLRFQDGITGTVIANFGCVRPHGHGLVICGTRATFVNDEPHGRLFTSRDPQKPPHQITTPHPGAAKGDLIASFLDGILGRGEPVVTTQDVFETMSVCLAIEKARRDRTIVCVEYI
jgi:predicted dehydrogenase